LFPFLSAATPPPPGAQQAKGLSQWMKPSQSLTPCGALMKEDEVYYLNDGVSA